MSENPYREKNHISIQKFIAITSMMLTILLLFQSTQVIREYVNRHGENEFYSDDVVLMKASETWTPGRIALDQIHTEADLKTALAFYRSGVTDVENEVRYLFYLGENRQELDVVSQWCELTKRQLIAGNRWPEIELMAGAEAVLIDGAFLRGEDDVAMMAQLAERGVSIVVCSMPDLTLVHGSEQLRALLGIGSIESDAQEYEAIWQFNGFLLGGELIYYPDKKEQDQTADEVNDFVGPWVRLLSGSKTYMAGMLEEPMRGELLPPVIWRYRMNDSYNFVVNGSFLSDVAGVGILETLMFEKSDYALYPTINAQMLSIVGFPVFTSENNDMMRAMYGRTQNAMQTEVLLPEMVALGERYNYVLTCFAAPQTDYGDDIASDPDTLGFFLRQMRSERAEIGLSTRQVNGRLPVAEKWAVDRKFLTDAQTTYAFNALYCEPDEIEEAARVTDVHTLIYPLGNDQRIVGFANEDTTLQSSLVDAAEIGYREILRLHSIETLLAYSNATIDLTRVMWPEKDADEWNRFRERVTSNISSYWNSYDHMDRMTISRGDVRTRSFLCCEAASRRDGDHLSVWTSHDDAWLMLRTHGEAVDKVVGGSAVEIETDAYLIHVAGTYAEIDLKHTVEYQYVQ